MQQQFNYAGLDSAADRLQCLKLEEGKQALVSFLETIPGMQSPPFVYCKVHWNSEMGDNGRLFQCFGGSCCEQITWQKGWGGEPGKFEANKARNRYYVPIVHYEPSQTNPAESCATIKYLDLTFTAYDSLIRTIKNTNEGLSFFERDITLETTKVNGATMYLFNKKESKALWQTNAVFKQQVEEQLPEVAIRLFNSMPKLMTESEFIAIKPQLDAKLQQAMQLHNSQQTQSAPKAEFATQTFAQPVVNIPVEPQVQQPAIPPMPTVEQVTQTVAQLEVPPTEPVVELPKVDLEFDPSKLL